MIDVVKHFGSAIAAVWAALLAGHLLKLLDVSGAPLALAALGPVVGIGAIFLAGLIEMIPKALFKLVWVGTVIYYGIFFWFSSALLLALATRLLGVPLSQPILAGFLTMVFMLVFGTILYKGGGWSRTAAFPKRASTTSTV